MTNNISHNSQNNSRQNSQQNSLHNSDEPSSRQETSNTGTTEPEKVIENAVDDAVIQSPQLIQSISTKTLRPMVSHFRGKLWSVFFSAFLCLVFIGLFFYLYSFQTRTLVESQLDEVQAQSKVQQIIFSKKVLLESMFAAETANQFTEQQEKLIKYDQRLIQVEPNNANTYKRWLKKNQANRETVIRTQSHSARNQQLKQSSVIQLQLIIFSMDDIIAKKAAQANSLYLQLHEDNITDNVTASRAFAYANAIKNVQSLEQLKRLFAEVLMEFERLTIISTLDSFESLRADVLSVLNDKNKTQVLNSRDMLELSEQMTSFEQIVISEQRALAKWQGHLRLTQQLRIDLKQQQQELQSVIDDLAQPKFKSNSPSIQNPLVEFLARYNIHISEHSLIIGLLAASGFCFVLFVYQLISVRNKLKRIAQQNVLLVKQAINNTDNNNGILIAEANCTETQCIIEHIQQIVSPEYSSEEAAALQVQYQQKSDDLLVQIDLNEQLQCAYKQLESTIESLSKEHFMTRCRQFDKLTAMVIQAMLQYQNSSLVVDENHKVNKAEVSVAKNSYRQLIRIFDWLEQHQTRLYLSNNDVVLTLSDVYLINEIHSALLNSVIEAQQQQNQIILSCDTQLTAYATVDAQLFQCLMMGLCRLLLSEQFNATLLLTLQVSDKNAGQQRVSFISKVFLHSKENNLHDEQTQTQTRGPTLPELLVALLDINDSSDNEQINTQTDNTPELALYVKSLLQHLFAENVSAQVIEQGYQLTFDMPITIAQKSETDALIAHEPSLLSQKTLQEVNVLLLCGDQSQAHVLAQHLHHAGAKVNIIDDAQHIVEYLNPSSIAQHHLDVVIVAADQYEYLPVIEQHIAALPVNEQPRVMVLQGKQQHPVKSGLYSQANNPLCEQAFITDIAKLIAEKAPSNQLLAAEQCQTHQYLATQVEVLLAVESPQNHQTLQRVLQWLGLQVHIVSQQQAQQQYWQTGRYLLLLTEFEASPCIELNLGKNIQRGVFSLSSCSNQWPQSDDVCAHWLLNDIEDSLDIETLATLLSPWLKKQVKAKTKVPLIHAKASMSKTNVMVAPSFDLPRYVQHQASPELAIFMLDDYIENNKEQLSVLSQACEQQSIEQVQTAIDGLTLNAKILAADDLLLLCQQWHELLEEDSDNALFSNDSNENNENTSDLLNETTEQLTLIASYADTV